jgi:hypothetical protein
MFDSAINKVVRLTIAHSPANLERVLAGQPPGLRIGVKHEVEQYGEAWRYEKARHSAYYLRRQGRGIMIWRWSYVATEHEAARLRALITALQGPLDTYRANRVFEQATHRTVINPRPIGMEFHAIDSGPYPALRVQEMANSHLAIATDGLPD